jgi:hypothetical protein
LLEVIDFDIGSFNEAQNLLNLLGLLKLFPLDEVILELIEDIDLRLKRKCCGFIRYDIGYDMINWCCCEGER